MAARSALLGDPSDASAEGNPARWLFGGPGREADVLIICAADRAEKGKALLNDVRDRAVACGARVLYEERATNWTGSARSTSVFRTEYPSPGCEVGCPGSG